MEKGNFRLLCAAVILATFCVFSPTASGAFVTIGDKNWRQVTETTDVSYFRLDEIYDTTTGMLDAGTTARGIDFSGWTWASVAEVAQLFTDTHATLNMDNRAQVDRQESEWAPNFLSLFDPTYTGVDAEAVFGLARDYFAPTQAYLPYIRDVPIGSDTAKLYLPVSSIISRPFRGVWLYQTASVPEPGLSTLLGITLVGLVAVGVVGRLRNGSRRKG